jgi:glycosyltransferase involved in cell wall biosynthesis
MQCPTLKDLPSPPEGKTGWPWNVESPSIMKASGFPCITIVTPNYNYGRFLEETIRSVLLQGHPNLEYIIIDGASTDESVKIIKKYEKWISYWVSEKDEGQSASINKGFLKSKGEIFNWLNSDDLLMPGALNKISEMFSQFPEFQWLTGGRMMVDERSEDLFCNLNWTESVTGIAYGFPIFPQDATFLKRSLFSEIGGVREDLTNIFDCVLHVQALARHPILLSRCIFSKMRLHKDQKTRNVDHIPVELSKETKPLLALLRFRSRLFYFCYYELLNGKLGPFMLGCFEEYRQWAKGDLLVNEVYYDLGNLRWKLLKH